MRAESLAVLSVGLYLCSIQAWAQAPLNACDLVAPFGTIDQNDVNAAINMSIGALPCTANIMGANVCNAVVTQRVVNAALGQGCLVGPHSVLLTWSTSARGTYPIKGYNVYRSTTNNPPQYTQINTALVTTLTFTDGVVSNNVTYYYVVTCVDTQNAESTYSAQVSVSIPSS